MRNPLSFFMTNVGDSFCNSYIYHLVGLHISDIGKEISSLVTCWGLWTATVRHSWAALWVHIVDCPQGKKLLVQIPDCHLTWDPCTRKLGGKICQEPRHEVPSAPPPVELHGKKWSLRLTELWPGRHLGSGIWNRSDLQKSSIFHWFLCPQTRKKVSGSCTHNFDATDFPNS